jgi:hypothetical protein
MHATLQPYFLTCISHDNPISSTAASHKTGNGMHMMTTAKTAENNPKKP